MQEVLEFEEGVNILNYHCFRVGLGLYSDFGVSQCLKCHTCYRHNINSSILNLRPSIKHIIVQPLNFH